MRRRCLLLSWANLDEQSSATRRAADLRGPRCGRSMYISASLFGPKRRQSGVNGHEWINQQLDLTPSEQKALEPIEAKFAKRKSTFSVSCAYP